MAATPYEYDAMGHLTRETLALAEDATVENSPIIEWAYGAESTEEGVFSLTTTTHYNAAGQPIASTQKQLISQLSSTLKGKMISVSKRGLTSMQWSVYNEATKRTRHSTVPTSGITAEAVTVNGFVLSQKDAACNVSHQANALNQYTMLSVDDITDFIPSYDAAGNQPRVKTSTGIWAISYDAENSPTDFTKVDSSDSTSIHCEYDHMGRRTTKKVTTNCRESRLAINHF